jgi:hypothetical protein
VAVGLSRRSLLSVDITFQRVELPPHDSPALVGVASNIHMNTWSLLVVSHPYEGTPSVIVLQEGCAFSLPRLDV